MAESLAINGTNLLTYMKSIQAIRGLVGPPPVRGGDFETPHRDGAVPGSLWAGPRPVTVFGTLYGDADGRPGYLDDVRALSALVYNDALPFTATRVIPRVSGGDLTVEASGRYAGGLESIEQAAHHAGRCVFDLQLLDAWWHDTSNSSISAFGGSTSPSVGGDVATRRVTLTFSGSTNQRLTNNTTGEWVQIVGNAGTPTVVDCEAFTATRSGISKAGEITHNSALGDEWFSLKAGTNSLTLTGGGLVSIVYRAAYA